MNIPAVLQRLQLDVCWHGYGSIKILAPWLSHQNSWYIWMFIIVYHCLSPLKWSRYWSIAIFNVSISWSTWPTARGHCTARSLIRKGSNSVDLQGQLAQSLTSLSHCFTIELLLLYCHYYFITISIVSLWPLVMWAKNVDHVTTCTKYIQIPEYTRMLHLQGRSSPAVLKRKTNRTTCWTGLRIKKSPKGSSGCLSIGIPIMDTIFR